MILPTKHLPLERTLLAGGADILGLLARPQTVSQLWDGVRGQVPFPTFDQLVLTLDVLFALRMIDLDEGRLRRTARS